MGIKYEEAKDIMIRIYDIAKTLGMEHVRMSGVYAMRSHGSGASRTIARCHALSKIWQLALGIDAVYIIEVIEERFGKMSREEQDKVIIHELMHIPLSFGGGFKHHDFVTHKNVDKIYDKYVQLKNNNLTSEFNTVKKEINEHEQKKGFIPSGFRRWF
jgi:predicted metallopeptidase